MRNHIFAAMLVGAALAGCAEEASTTDEWIPDGPTKPIRPTSRDFAVDERDIAPGRLAYDTSCEPLADDGPCSLLCDPDALLEQHVPEGTCVVFVCTLRDGTERSLGGCR